MQFLKVNACCMLSTWRVYCGVQDQQNSNYEQSLVISLKYEMQSTLYVYQEHRQLNLSCMGLYTWDCFISLFKVDNYWSCCSVYKSTDNLSMRREADLVWFWHDERNSAIHQRASLGIVLWDRSAGCRFCHQKSHILGDHYSNYWHTFTKTGYHLFLGQYQQASPERGDTQCNRSDSVLGLQLYFYLSPLLIKTNLLCCFYVLFVSTRTDLWVLQGWITGYISDLYILYMTIFSNFLAGNWMFALCCIDRNDHLYISLT